jgi:hypothetical protein
VQGLTSLVTFCQRSVQHLLTEKAVRRWCLNISQSPNPFRRDLLLHLMPLFKRHKESWLDDKDITHLSFGGQKQLQQPLKFVCFCRLENRRYVSPTVLRFRRLENRRYVTCLRPVSKRMVETSHKQPCDTRCRPAARELARAGTCPARRSRERASHGGGQACS